MDNTDSKPTIMTHNTADIKYEKNDIIIINENGVKKKRHIFGESPIVKKMKYGDNEYTDYLYQVDYGLMFEHEGFVLQSNIICKAGPEHDHLPL